MLKASLDKSYHGKLLLTGEYFVLDGVPALAVPTKLGQRFTTSLTRGMGLFWMAKDLRGKQWFKTSINWDGSLGYNHSPNAFTKRLYEILQAADRLRPGVLQAATSHYAVHSQLEFERLWGLGTSSTLIAFMAQWLGVNPYELLEDTFGGSGYDLACAIADGPIRYIRNGTTPEVTPLDWRPEWLHQTYFVYRNQKQNSREGIRAYRQAEVTSQRREEVAQLTAALTSETPHLRAAQNLLKEHESLVGDTLGLPPVQEELFADFPGQLKSLGAWGGDFMWALSDRPATEVTTYFNERGLRTVIPYEELILQ
ncbi:GYDIA family GHMP kinase [Lewinella sp. 4G2]|uniref:GYDIA family GHMP kinase n=1 Tax=Lewinella sp. 4G2 TaxID=1803372 RepID=UPI0007B48BE9|nr:GYDIA family GHMP kinase [Lewinella sp. 4G2]OAV43925.1 hypothetical protein A3850_005195 [Lewinella sp. 4G2]